jgi:hypothetical protein
MEIALPPAALLRQRARFRQLYSQRFRYEVGCRCAVYAECQRRCAVPRRYAWLPLLFAIATARWLSPPLLPS